MTGRTTAQWWEEVSNDPEKMIDWLKKQYHGERTAADRIQDMILNIPGNAKDAWRRRVLNGIVVDEIKHAIWVEDLLKSRGIAPAILEKEERYWNETLPAAEGKSFEYMCAGGHLAETMRLDRIKLLAEDSRFSDIAEVFQKILPDEEFHAKLFAVLSTPEDIEEARKYHNEGMNALGLVP